MPRCPDNAALERALPHIYKRVPHPQEETVRDTYEADGGGSSVGGTPKGVRFDNLLSASQAAEGR